LQSDHANAKFCKFSEIILIESGLRLNYCGHCKLKNNVKNTAKIVILLG